MPNPLPSEVSPPSGFVLESQNIPEPPSGFVRSETPSPPAGFFIQSKPADYGAEFDALTSQKPAKNYGSEFDEITTKKQPLNDDRKFWSSPDEFLISSGGEIQIKNPFFGDDNIKFNGENSEFVHLSRADYNKTMEARKTGKIPGEERSLATLKESLPSGGEFFQKLTEPFRVPVTKLGSDEIQRGLGGGTLAENLASAAQYLTEKQYGVDPGSTQTEKPGTTAKIASGVVKAGLGAGDMLTDPVFVASMGSSALPSAAQRLISAGFTADILRQTPELTDRLAEAMASGDAEQKTQALADVIVNAFFLKGAATHAATPAHVAASEMAGRMLAQEVLAGKEFDPERAREIARKLSLPEAPEPLPASTLMGDVGNPTRTFFDPAMGKPMTLVMPRNIESDIAGEPEPLTPSGVVRRRREDRSLRGRLKVGAITPSPEPAAVPQAADAASGGGLPASAPVVEDASRPSMKVAAEMTPEAIQAELESVQKQISELPKPKSMDDLTAKNELLQRAYVLREAQRHHEEGTVPKPPEPIKPVEAVGGESGWRPEIKGWSARVGSYLEGDRSLADVLELAKNGPENAVWHLRNAARIAGDETIPGFDKQKSERLSKLANTVESKLMNVGGETAPESKPAAPAVEKPKGALAITQEYNRLLEEYGLQLGWMSDGQLELIAGDSKGKGQQGTASIKGRIEAGKARGELQRRAVQELGGEQPKAALLEKLKQKIAEHEAEQKRLEQDADDDRTIPTGASTDFLPGESGRGTPKLAPGEKGTGDLLKGQREDFALVGEKATDAERIAAEKAKAEQDRLEAKAIADKAQLGLPGTEQAPTAETGKGEKYQIKGSGPQTFSIVERLAQSEVEKANGEQSVRVRNDKTGAEQVVEQSDLKPVQDRTSEAKAPKTDLDAELRARKLDQSGFPDAKSKRAAIQRHDALNGIKSGIEGAPDEGQSAVPIDTAGVEIRLRESGEVLWGATDEIQKVFADAIRPSVGKQGAGLRGRLGATFGVPARTGNPGKETFQKTRVFIPTDAASPAVRQNAEILADRILQGSWGKGEPSRQLLGADDFIHALSRKLPSLKVVFREVRNEDGTPSALMQYDRLPGVGDFISVNTLHLGKYDLSRPEVRALMDIAYSEELIHAVTRRKATKDELTAVWRSLKPEERAGVLKSYGNVKTDEMGGFEYVRIILQKILHGETTEEHNPKWTFSDATKKVLGKILDGLREAFGLKPKNDLARAMVDRLESAIRGDEPITGDVFANSESISSGIDREPLTDEEIAKREQIRFHGNDVGVLGKSSLDPVAGRADTTKLFTDSGFQPVLRPDGLVGLADESWPGFNAEGQRLLEKTRGVTGLMVDMAKAGQPPNDLLMNYVYSVRGLAMRMLSEQRAGNPTAIDDVGLLNDLFQASHQIVRNVAQQLREAQRYTPEFTTRMRYVDTELMGTLGEMYGGDIVRKVLTEIGKGIGRDMTPEEITRIINSDAELNKFVGEVQNSVNGISAPESGSKLFRLFNSWQKPKVAKKLSALENDARVKEALDQLVQNALANGFTEPVSKTKPLTSLYKLILMAKPESAVKLDEMIARAVRESERKAARDAVIAEGLSEEDLAAYDARTADATKDGPDPTPEQVEQGMNDPKFGGWKKVREALLGYSPVTDVLVKKVVREDFRGTRFGDPNAPKPVDTRIDLNKLAVAPEAEVARVLNAHLENIRNNLDLGGATPWMKVRIERQVREAVAAQLAAARSRVLNNFYEPKTNLPATASQRLRKLMNAGITSDPRFQTEPTRRLVKRIASEYADGSEIGSLATSTRAEKQQWMEQKLNEILSGERLHERDVGADAADYFEAVARTYLAERLQAAEERITRSFLKGADVKYERNVLTPEQRARNLNDAKRRVEELARAGAIDTSMVEAVSRKGAIQRLVPSMPEMIERIFKTPVLKRGDLAERFADAMVDDLGIDPGQREKARAVFESAFEVKLREAASRAIEQAQRALTPEERTVAAPSTKLWQRIINAANAGALDDFVMLREIAKAHRHPISDADIQKIKDLAAREQSLRELRPWQLERLAAKGITPEMIPRYNENATGLTPEQVKALGIEQSHTEGTKQEQDAVHNEIVTLWAKLTNPVGRGSEASRQNMVRAVNEVAKVNGLFRLTFAPVQTIDVFFGNILHNFTTAMAHASLRVPHLKEAGFQDWLHEYTQAVGNTLRLQVNTYKAGLAAGTLALKSAKGLPQRVEGMTTTIHAVDRMLLKAQELMRGDATSRALAVPLYLAASIRFGYRFAGALDAAQTSGTRFPELQSMIKTWLIRDGRLNRAEVDRYTDEIVGDIQSEMAAAAAIAPDLLRAYDIKETPADLRVAAWNMVYAKILERAKQAGLPTDQFQKDIEQRMQTLGWNLPEKSWVGKMFGGPLRAVEDAAAKAYFPTGLITGYANAVSIAVLQKLATGTPLGLKPGIFAGSPSVEGELNSRQTQMKSATVTAIFAPLALAVMSGLIKVITKWPDDKEERAKMEAAGLKPGIALIPIGNGNYVSTSLTVGPLAFGSPWLAAAGAIYDVRKKHAQAQEKLNAEARKKGIAPGVAPGWSFQEMLGVTLGTAWDAVQGTRTAGGKIGSFTDYGKLVGDKAVANYITGFMPGLPMYQNAAGLAGIDIDPRLANVGEMLVPTTGGPRRVNMFGEPVTQIGDVQNIVTRITRGTGAIVNMKDIEANTPYANIFATGYVPPQIQPNRGYNFNGSLRPMSQDEQQKYAQLRGQYFAQELTALGQLDSSPESVKAAGSAFKRANQRALSAVGASVPDYAHSRPASASYGRTRSTSRFRISTRRSRGGIGSLRGSRGRRGKGGLRGRIGRSRRKFTLA